MYRAKIFVKRRRTILDPQGKAIELGVKSIGISNVEDIRMDKYFELTVNENDEIVARKIVDKICDSLLANPHLEDYHFELERL